MQRPNISLTAEEMAEKRILKRKLKLQSRRRTLEVKLLQARKRRDTETERRVLQRIDDFWEQDDVKDLLGDNDASLPSSWDNQDASQPRVPAVVQRRIELIYQDLARTFRSSSKAQQVQEGRVLMAHMTKGTSVTNMYRSTALVGYTRQKFIERALLLAASLEKLNYLPNSAWKESVAKVNRVVSIGCGPGCDALGMAAFRRVPLAEVLFLDWAIEKWKLNGLEELSRLMVPDLVVSADRVRMGFCDATKSAEDAVNHEALNLILNGVFERSAWDSSGSLVLTISYLLTELRGQLDFFDPIVAAAPAGTFFYISDPTAWMIHPLLEKHGDVLEHVWLDSSMHKPELQPLEGRVGPAVVLARKR